MPHGFERARPNACCIVRASREERFSMLQLVVSSASLRRKLSDLHLPFLPKNPSRPCAIMRSSAAQWCLLLALESWVCLLSDSWRSWRGWNDRLTDQTQHADFKGVCWPSTSAPLCADSVNRKRGLNMCKRKLTAFKQVLFLYICLSCLCTIDVYTI